MARLIKLNYSVGCSGRCDECDRYFDCSSERKISPAETPLGRLVAQNMQQVRFKVAVMSGKGGVGKSTVAANLAVALAKKYTVGLVDLDLDGPSIPRLLGVKGCKLELRDHSFGIIPVAGAGGVKVISTGFVLEDDDAITWFSKLRLSTLEQFLSLVEFGELDFLVFDLPPGTGAETANLFKCLPGLSGAVIVTIPAQLSQDVARRAIRLCQKVGVPIFGVIENMSGLLCPNCRTVVATEEETGGERLARSTGVRFLGRIPLDRRVAEHGDQGQAFVETLGGEVVGQAFSHIVEQIEQILMGDAVHGPQVRDGRGVPEEKP